MATSLPDELKKKNNFGDAAAATGSSSVQRIPTAGMPAPAPDGLGDNTELSRNVNNGLNALGGMGVVSSVPLGFGKLAQGTALATTRPVAASAPAFQSLPGVNAALQEGAQANALAGATRSLGNASAGLTAADRQNGDMPAVAASRATGATGTWDAQAPQSGATGTWDAPAESQTPQSEYARQMGKVGGFFVDRMKTLVSAPGYGFNKTDAASTAGAGGDSVNPTQTDVRTDVQRGGAMPAPSSTTPGPATPAPANPGRVMATRQPNGVMAFSGENISGPVSYAGASGFKPSGAGVTVVPGGSFANGSPSGDAAVSAARFAAAGRGDMNAVRDSYLAPGQSFGGETKESLAAERLKTLALSPAGTPGRKAAMQMYSEQMTATTARQTQDAANKIAQQRLGFEGKELEMKQTAAGFASRSARRIEDLQMAYNVAKPEDKLAIAEQIRVASGHDKAAQWKGVAIAGRKNTDGSTNDGDLALFNEHTGEAKRADHPAVANAAAQEGAISEVSGKKAKLTWVPF